VTRLAAVTVGAVALAAGFAVGWQAPVASEPIAAVEVTIREGGRYPLPWQDAPECPRLQPGCFEVVRLTSEIATIRFPRFGLQRAVEGTTARFEIGAASTPGPLLVTGDGDHERWTYARYLGDRTLRFVAYDGWSPDDASVDRRVTFDPRARRWREVLEVRTDGPLSLLATPLPAGAVMQRLTLDGRPVRFGEPGIVQLTVPPGRHRVETVLRPPDDPPVALAALLEPRQMAAQGTATVRIEAAPAVAELRPVGLPASAWARVPIRIEPPATGRTSPTGVATRYELQAPTTITVPERVLVADRRYPILPWILSWPPTSTADAAGS
jgi:hypothetical protein